MASVVLRSVMEFYFVDKDLNRLIAPLDGIVSLEWRLRFFEWGTFRAVFPRDCALYSVAMKASYFILVCDGEIRCGRIDEVRLSEKSLIVAGRTAESLLADRVIMNRFLMAGTVSNVIASAVLENCRALPIAVGDDSDAIHVMGIFSAEWENMAEWVYRVLRAHGASYRVDFEPERGFVFRIVKPDNESHAVLSTSFGNITDVNVAHRMGEKKNKVYVQGGDGKILFLDHSNGEAKREIFRRADDLSADQFDTDAEYTEALRARAAEILVEYETAGKITCRVAADDPWRFGRDYRLGDICYAADEETGIRAKVRIVGADEIWENGERRIALSLMF